MNGFQKKKVESGGFAIIVGAVVAIGLVAGGAAPFSAIPFLMHRARFLPGVMVTMPFIVAFQIIPIKSMVSVS